MCVFVFGVWDVLVGLGQVEGVCIPSSPQPPCLPPPLPPTPGHGCSVGVGGQTGHHSVSEVKADR